MLGKLSPLFKMLNVKLGVGKVQRGGDISERVQKIDVTESSG